MQTTHYVGRQNGLYHDFHASPFQKSRFLKDEKNLGELTWQGNKRLIVKIWRVNSFWPALDAAASALVKLQIAVSCAEAGTSVHFNPRNVHNEQGPRGFQLWVRYGSGIGRRKNWDGSGLEEEDRFLSGQCTVVVHSLDFTRLKPIPGLGFKSSSDCKMLPTCDF